jgi:hypothetical protein
MFASIVTNNPNLVLFVTDSESSKVSHANLATPGSLVQDATAEMVLSGIMVASIAARAAKEESLKSSIKADK